MAGLLAAQQALRQGNATFALQKLDEHARRFEHSQFDEERSAARILALCALGRLEEGRTLLAAFTRRFRESPATPRVSAAPSRCSAKARAARVSGRQVAASAAGAGAAHSARKPATARSAGRRIAAGG
jgi:hypothetical protein